MDLRESNKSDFARFRSQHKTDIDKLTKKFTDQETLQRDKIEFLSKKLETNTASKNDASVKLVKSQKSEIAMLKSQLTSQKSTLTQKYKTQ